MVGAANVFTEVPANIIAAIARIENNFFIAIDLKFVLVKGLKI
jgi:hypothetical protein